MHGLVERETDRRVVAKRGERGARQIELRGALVFGVYLALIAGFLLFLKMVFGIKLDLLAFLREVRLLLKLQIVPEALNALYMLVFMILALIMIGAVQMEGGRRFVQYLLGGVPNAPPQIPAFVLFMILLALFVLVMVCSQVFCVRHRRAVARGRPPGEES